MTGDCHVRFCERLGAKLPRPTDLRSRSVVDAVNALLALKSLEGVLI